MPAPKSETKQESPYKEHFRKGDLVDEWKRMGSKPRHHNLAKIGRPAEDVSAKPEPEEIEKKIRKNRIIKEGKKMSQTCELCGKEGDRLVSRHKKLVHNSCAMAMTLARDTPRALVEALRLSGHWQEVGGLSDEARKVDPDVEAAHRDKILTLEALVEKLTQKIIILESIPPVDVTLWAKENKMLKAMIEQARDLLLAGTDGSLVDAVARFKQQFHEEFQEGDRCRQENKDLKEISERLKEECAILRQGVQNIVNPTPARDTAILDFLHAVESGTVQVSHILKISGRI